MAIGATTKPNLIYGFGISAQWKGFDFNAHFQGAGKSSFFINGSTVYAFKDSQWGNILTNLVDVYKRQRFFRTGVPSVFFFISRPLSVSSVA